MGAGNIIGGFLMFLLVIWAVVAISFGVYADYKYENAIGSHMEMAVDTITPESFKQELVLAKQAMLDAGLTENDYGAMWLKKPDNSMKFQFRHIDSIIERADAMIQWKNTVYANQTSVPSGYASAEAFRDVYNDKMNQLRLYIKEGGIRSDWIAEDAWYVKNHPIMYLWLLFTLLWIIVFIISWTLIAIDSSY